MSNGNGQNGTLLDVAEAIEMHNGVTITLDELCSLLPHRGRDAISSSMRSLEKTSSEVLGITVVKKEASQDMAHRGQEDCLGCFQAKSREKARLS